MRNLKKVLALLVALTMAFGLMISAAAFTDDSSIVNDDAADMLTQLQIIKGFPDGSFQPAGLVTRAQMAKMVYVALRGGNDDLGVAFTNASVQLTDIASHWAKGYIKYAFAYGIIAGFPDGSFKPDANVTGYQAAKMLLVALGYNSDIEGYTGTGWDYRVAVDAAAAGLLDDIEDIDLSLPLSRDNAAQMIYNAIFAYMVTYDDGILNEEDYTFASKRLKLEEVTGILTKTDEYGIGGTSDDDTCVLDGTFDLDCDADPALIGQEVKVYVKATDKDDDGNIDEDEVSKVYGKPIATDDNLVVTTYLADFDDDDDDVDVTTDTDVYYNYDAAKSDVTSVNADGEITGLSASAASFTPADGDKVIFISNDGDDDNYEVILAIENFFDEADIRTPSSGDTISVDAIGMNREDVEDVAGAEDIEDGDYVLANEFNGNFFVEKIEGVDGTIKGRKGVKINVDGTYYEAAKDAGLMADLQAESTGTEITAYYYGGFIVSYETDDSDATPAAYCAIRGAQGAIDGDALGNDGQDAKVAVTLSDGTEKVYLVDSVDDVDFDGDDAADAGEEDLTDDDYDWNADADDAIQEYIGSVFEYSMDGDKIVLEERVASMTGTDAIDGAYTGGSLLHTDADDYVVNSATNFFLIDVTDWTDDGDTTYEVGEEIIDCDFEVVIGKTAAPDLADNKYVSVYDAEDYTAATATVVLSNDVDGVADTGNYAILIDYDITDEGEDDDYYVLNVFDGENFTTLKTDDLAAYAGSEDDLNMGCVIDYTLDGGKVTEFTIPTMNAVDGTKIADGYELGYALAYDAGEFITMRTAGNDDADDADETYELDDETIVELYDLDETEPVALTDDVDPTTRDVDIEDADPTDGEDGNVIIKVDADGNVTEIYFFSDETFDIDDLND